MSSGLTCPFCPRWHSKLTAAKAENEQQRGMIDKAREALKATTGLLIEIDRGDPVEDMDLAEDIEANSAVIGLLTPPQPEHGVEGKSAPSE